MDSQEPDGELCHRLGVSEQPFGYQIGSIKLMSSGLHRLLMVLGVSMGCAQYSSKDSFVVMHFISST